MGRPTGNAVGGACQQSARGGEPRRSSFLKRHASRTSPTINTLLNRMEPTPAVQKLTTTTAWPMVDPGATMLSNHPTGKGSAP